MKQTIEKKALTPELTEEENQHFADKAMELATQYNVPEVHPVVFIDPDTKERIVGYLKEPTFVQEIRIMDVATMSGFYSAADQLREAILIKEESDPLCYSEENDPLAKKVKLGIVDYCLNMIKRLQNQFKKK